MTDHVKRSYSSPRRRRQADETRTAILTAAGRLFRDQGYAVPMPAIADEAGVAVETVYRVFGTKAALFRAVVDAMLSGGVARARVPVEERPAIRAIIEEPDPRRQIERYAATQPGIHRRAGPILRALRDAKATDPALADLWAEMEAWRLEGQGRFVERLAGQGSLRPGPHARGRDRDRVHAVLTRGVRPAGPGAWLVRRSLRSLAGGSAHGRIARRLIRPRRPRRIHRPELAVSPRSS